MQVTNAEFVTSAVEFSKCPPPDMPEYAFIGRSNVGKSSLINMLVNKKGLAKTSGTPGKTRTINHFKIESDRGSWFLVDLPGYGYAKIGQEARKKWEAFVRTYLDKRENLLNTFVLIDVRHEPQKLDLEFMQWMGQKGIPFSIVFTKCDKLSERQLIQQFAIYEERMLEDWTEMPPHFLTSADSRMGRDEMLKFIASTNPIFKS